MLFLQFSAIKQIVLYILMTAFLAHVREIRDLKLKETFSIHYPFEKYLRLLNFNTFKLKEALMQHDTHLRLT